MDERKAATAPTFADRLAYAVAEIKDSLKPKVKPSTPRQDQRLQRDWESIMDHTIGEDE